MFRLTYKDKNRKKIKYERKKNINKTFFPHNRKTTHSPTGNFVDTLVSAPILNLAIQPSNTYVISTGAKSCERHLQKVTYLSCRSLERQKDRNMNTYKKMVSNFLDLQPTNIYHLPYGKSPLPTGEYPNSFPFFFFLPLFTLLSFLFWHLFRDLP